MKKTNKLYNIDIQMTPAMGITITITHLTKDNELYWNVYAVNDALPGNISMASFLRLMSAMAKSTS